MDGSVFRQHRLLSRFVRTVAKVASPIPFLPCSISRLSNGRWRTADRDKEFAELGIDVLVTAVDEELDVLDDFQDRASSFERLRRYPGAVTIVDKVMPPLED